MFSKILVPTDGSSMANTVALASIEFARKVGGELVGIFVIPELQYPIYIEATPPTYLTNQEYRASMQTIGGTFLNQIKKAADSASVPFTGHVLFFESVPSGIVTSAEEYGCDLIFMGSRGKTECHQLLLGSVTSKVLALSSVPVLVYRHPDETKATNESVNSASRRKAI